MKLRIAMNAVLLLALLGNGTPQENPEAQQRLSPDVAEGLLVYKVEPVYPQMAQIAHIQGDVVLTTYISKDGSVENLRAVSGHPILTQSSIDAVKQWKYEPFKVGGAPVAVQTTVTVKYRL